LSSRFAPSEQEVRAERRLGLINGFAAYALWGLLPLYFKLLPSVSAIEVVAHRIIWSVAFLALLLGAIRQYPLLLAALGQRRIVGAMTLSAILIAINWLVFIWAIGAHHVLAGSLGYFLNPLVNILIGTIFLHEKLGRGQKLAVAIAAIGVAVLAAGEIQTLWISLTLAFSFAFYGLVRKLTPVPAAVGLAIETLILLPAALASLVWLGMDGSLAFGRAGMEAGLLVGLGAVTSVPLLLFAGAARRLPMVSLGLLQYLAPSLQFLISIFLFGEPLSPVRLASFALIWAALALFVRESLRARPPA
jgi:chloramphenicol-sensitive protein RarD